MTVPSDIVKVTEAETEGAATATPDSEPPCVKVTDAEEESVPVSV